MTTPMSDAGISGGRLRLARVSEQTFSVLRQDFLLLFVVAALSDIIPGLLHLSLSPQVSGSTAAAATDWVATLRPLFPFISIVGGIISLLAYAALSWAGVERLQGRKPLAGAMLTAGSSTLLTNIGLAILGGLAVLLGSLVLVVPGLMLATAWLVVVPVATCEKRGVFSSFKQSASLTKGNRWRIFLLLVVFWISVIIVLLVASLIVQALFGIKDDLLLGNPSGPVAYLVLALQIPVEGVVRMVGAVGVAVVYHELRALKGGFDVRRLTDVFS